MKVLIVEVQDFPNMGRDLWEKIKTSFRLNELNKFHKVDVSTDKILTIVKESSNEICNIINELKETNKEFCVTSHRQINECSTSITYATNKNENPYSIIFKLITSLTKHEDINNSFDELWDFIKKNSNEKLMVSLFALFLPLDLDTQALNKLLNNKKIAVKYLKEMLAEEDSLFINKFENAKKDIEGITDENYRKKLGALFDKKGSYIHNFLTLLDILTAMNKQKKEGLTEMDLENNQFGSAVNSFQCWYCKFTKCTLFFSLRLFMRFVL